MAEFPQLDTPLLIEESHTIAGGIVNNIEAHLLQPGQAAHLLNISPTVDGRRQKREGVDAIGTMGITNPNGLFALEAPLQNVRVLVAQYGSKLWSTPGDNTFTGRATTVSLYDTPYMGVVGRGATNTASLFLTSCVPVTNNVSLPYGNLICLDRGFSFTEIATVRPRACAWFQSRLWTLNNCNTNAGPDYLNWSAPLDGRNFSNGQNVQIDPDTGDQGIALVPLRDSTPNMLIFKERSIHLLSIYWTTDGYYTTTGNTLDFTKSLLRPITLETGAVATRGVVWTPGAENADILFLSREGIRSLNRSLTDSQGGAGLPLSYRVQGLVDRINWQAANRAVASYWNGVAYFALPLDGAINNNYVLAYDAFRDAFWFLDWNVSAWAPCQLTAERKHFFLGSNFASAVSESYGTGVSLGYHIYETETGSIDPGGSPIDFTEETRAFSFDIDGTPGSGLKYRKRWRWLDLAYQAAGTTATLTVNYKIDDDPTWTLLKHLPIDPADGSPYLPVELPFSFSSTEMHHRKLALDNLVPGYKIQFQLVDDTSFARLKILNLGLAANPINLRFD